MQLSIHHVEEGHVGVYYRGGALLPNVTEAGYNIMIPLVTRMEQVQITIQTDEVRNIPCGTRGGIMTQFDKVEVVNQLPRFFVYDTIKQYGTDYDKTWIFDKVHHEMNQFCSQHTLQEVYIDKFDTVDDRLREALQKDCTDYGTGINIIAVRVTKPTIPNAIRKNYEEIEAKKTEYLIAVERQRVVEKEAETERRRAKIEAEKIAEVAFIRKEQEIREQEGSRNVSSIMDAMHLAKERAMADANAYRLRQEAETNKALLTKEYLDYMRSMAIANQSKIYFGDKIPSMFSWGAQILSQPTGEGA
jgi:regulator of protease activity HflC (stomatin/prohibitin superfamily)